jgi:hypothetical protein
MWLLFYTQCKQHLNFLYKVWFGFMGLSKTDFLLVEEAWVPERTTTLAINLQSLSPIDIFVNDNCET